MQQLSAQDAQFLYMETNKSLSQVTSVAIFDPSTAPSGTVRFKEIIEHVRSRLHTSPIYKRRIYHVPLELDYPYWVDDEHFDIEYHIRHGRLPHPADWRQLCIHLARFHSRPLDMQRAPWEMYVIEGIDNVPGIPSGAYAVATKIHHAAADGMAIVNFFGGLMDIDQKGTPVMPVKQRVNSNRYEKPTPFQMSARGLINYVRSPMQVANSFMRYAPGIVQQVKRQITEKQQEAKTTVPITRFNLETSPHRVFDSTSFSLEEFKPLRGLVKGCTINDMVLAICSGALRKYLGHHKELPSESLRAFVPVNVRASKGSLSETDHPGNNISTMSPLLRTDIADPVERLAAIHAETREQKAARKGISARLMTDVTRHIPASTQLLAARLMMRSEMAGRMTNVCISNVPGPQVPVYMNGAKLVHQMGLGPLADRMGLFIAVTSYDGRMSFSATSCRRTMPDVDFFMQCIRESFSDLSAAAVQAMDTKADNTPTKKVSQKVSSKKRVSKKTTSSKKKSTKKASKRAAKK
ncbi:diacylglycerol O-acyltransferase [Arenicella chitinivorans]|uniref:diacylglycerol O-acyltransferase n=1 Tax=Arenicella chitinivorans TaxID=1329800 RepID=A0A918RNW8_9GAMM|nr:wax ester/triacylglycerol synthase family O-acyltransferase [Arenicella chitinivorans]GHA04495.1 diacylglycerol O-acyltransferase [Arenicella chitinivorans]